MQNGSRSLRQTSIWLDWYAWHPVITNDDGLYWLELIYRRKTAHGRWEYRSTQTNAEKEVVAASRKI